MNEKNDSQQVLDDKQPGRDPQLSIPLSLKLEHRDIHAELANAMREPGLIGEAATAVDRLLQPHIVKEEQFVFPLLGLLDDLIAGRSLSDVDDIIAMAERLKRDLPEMLTEHQAIIAALHSLASAGRTADRLEYVHFAEQLKAHAQTEEEVLYPAAILVGEFLKLKLGK